MFKFWWYPCLEPGRAWQAIRPTNQTKYFFKLHKTPPGPDYGSGRVIVDGQDLQIISKKLYFNLSLNWASLCEFDIKLSLPQIKDMIYKAKTLFAGHKALLTIGLILCYRNFKLNWPSMPSLLLIWFRSMLRFLFHFYMNNPVMIRMPWSLL